MDQLIPGTVAENRSDALGVVSGRSDALRILDAHRKGLMGRRQRDLLAERILLHIDGTGDNGYADIFNGERTAIPLELAEHRVSEPLLGPIVTNQVAYHTTMPIRFLAEARNDSDSRERAIVDTAFANYVAHTQRLNDVSAAAMLFADACGFCPIHAYWRDDVGYDPYEPLYLTQDVMTQLGLTPPKKGLVDLWVGNPFDHVFNPGAKRGSVQWQTYGRVVPGQMVRDRFNKPHLQGSKRLPSASIFQRTARIWSGLVGLNLHGTPAIYGAEDSTEDLLALICFEQAPGYDVNYPDGRLVVIALPGAAETTQDRSRTAGGTPEVLHDAALPGGRFSNVNIYSSGGRFDDVHGQPWAGPIDELNIRLNIVLAKQWKMIEKAAEAPTIVSGMIDEDEKEFNGFTLLTAHDSAHTLQAHPLPVDHQIIQILDNRAERIRQAMFTIGGYQAASRGESNAGDPFAKVALLAQQDDTVHGPTNQSFRVGLADFAQTWWCLMKQYGDVPWIIDAIGDEFEQLPEDYIDNTMLSQEPPNYKVVSGYGATPEIKGRQLMELVQLRTADGEPALRTEEFRKQWPDGSLFANSTDPGAVQRRRANKIAKTIRRLAKQFRQITKLQERQMGHPWVQQAAFFVFQQLEAEFPPLRDDDPHAMLAALSEITQDETEDGLARVVAMFRQGPIYDWIDMMAQQQAVSGMPTMLPGAPKQLGAGGGGPVKPGIELNPGEALAQRSATAGAFSNAKA